MDPIVSRISIVKILNDSEISDSEKIAQIRLSIGEAEAVSTPGIIQRLVATPKEQGGFDWVNPNITDDNFPTTKEPSLDGAQLDEIVGSWDYVLAELKRRGRRAPTMAEGLLYGITNPDEQRKYWIWCLGQVWADPDDRREYALVLGAFDGGRNAGLGGSTVGAGAGDRVLSFPL
jgi:hypothetical protein